MQKPVYQTERKPIIDFLGVGFPGSWPKADSSKCSMFEAINIAGSAILGDKWTGQELRALEWLFAPDAAEKFHREHSTRDAWKNKAFPSNHKRLIIRGNEQINGHVLAWYKHQVAIRYEESLAAEQVPWLENQASVARLTSAVEWIACKCRDSELQSYYRFVTGGQIGSIAGHEWNVESPIHRFLSKGYYSRWFATSEPIQQFDVYVFFDRLALEQFTSKLQFSPVLVSASDLSELSPFLQLAVKIALLKGYKSAATAETQHIREAELEAAWDEALPDIPRTKRAVEAMAKVIGFPDIKAIRDGQKAQEVRKSGGTI